MAMNNAVPSLESMLEFQEVYLCAVALSWKNETFKKALLDNPLDALARYFDYTCPWIIDLKVTKADGDSGWVPGDKHTGHWRLPRGIMTFGVPDRPSKDDEEAIALAAYNDAGPCYLFTCC
ncbi:hypothetical protein PPGU19_098760 (plasmid) [Paraburkholderia sp. PGU19]|uniref:BMA_0021/BMA_0022 family TOMM bacteriocin n=1 Tax=Paraburkholderia sp. PGU19 TaxID=2735434 RepID=UPI0015DB9BF3|nr:BMA_0021/BMA_0022 family TOMM bacteriocin [Paraburkholderia sp. PGU19]BCG05308.1 hypothetical protein PPGU19_098760 [Paraburkholderia sp. PGU19]